MCSKKIISLLMVGLLAFGAVSCGSNTKDSSKEDSKKTEDVSNEEETKKEIDKAKEEEKSKVDKKEDSKAKEEEKSKANEEKAKIEEKAKEEAKVKAEAEAKAKKEAKAKAEKKAAVRKECEEALAKGNDFETNKRLELKTDATYARQAVESTCLENWDKILNEIYNNIKTVLTDSEMNDLKNEELKWINFRDAEAQRCADVYKGGTESNVAFYKSLCETTRNRCNELVDRYLR